MAAGQQYLFVYGTLRRGTCTPASQFLESIAIWLGVGRTRGVMFQLDRYPGMTDAASDSDWVRGDVFLLNHPARAWPILDQYEGCGPANPSPHEFERKIVPVEMQEGGRLDAWAYFYRFDISGRARIASGDYLQSVSSSV